MTWRLDSAVIRGELFNLRPNHVHGWLELAGAPSVIHLGLTGNLEGELFGKRVQFETNLAARGQESGVSEQVSASCPDFEALEIQQIGPTGRMQLLRSLAKNGAPGDVRLSLQWYSQNGEVQIDLVNPHIEFVEDGEGQSETAKPTEDDSASVFVRDADDELPDFPDDADDEDPYGLFPPQLEEQLEVETKNADITALDEAAIENAMGGDAAFDDPLGESPFEDRPKRSWDEVIPGIDEQTKRLYESWDEIFEGKKDVPLCTIFDPPLTVYPVDKLSDAEVEAALKVILRRLAMHSVALDMCEHFTPRDAYRLLVEEILPKSPIYPGLPLTGYVQHYSTWEYCRKCDEEFEAKWQAEEKQRREREARDEEDGDRPRGDDIPF